MNISISRKEFEACGADETDEVVVEMRRTLEYLNSISDKWKKADLNQRVREILKTEIFKLK